MVYGSFSTSIPATVGSNVVTVAPVVSSRLQTPVSPACFIEWCWIFACGDYLSWGSTYVSHTVFDWVSGDGDFGGGWLRRRHYLISVT